MYQVISFVLSSNTALDHAFHVPLPFPSFSLPCPCLMAPAVRIDSLSEPILTFPQNTSGRGPGPAELVQHLMYLISHDVHLVPQSLMSSVVCQFPIIAQLPVSHPHPQLPILDLSSPRPDTMTRPYSTSDNPIPHPGW